MAGLPYQASAGGEVLPGLNDDVPLAAGTVLRLRTTGGGGWGNPFEREPELVLQDVVRGLVSEESAERDYGVVVRDGRLVDLRRPHRERPFIDRGSGYQEMSETSSPSPRGEVGGGPASGQPANSTET
jgi:N-methylhydantoinase B